MQHIALNYNVQLRGGKPHCPHGTALYACIHHGFSHIWGNALVA